MPLAGTGLDDHSSNCGNTEQGVDEFVFPNYSIMFIPVEQCGKTEGCFSVFATHHLLWRTKEVSSLRIWEYGQDSSGLLILGLDLHFFSQDLLLW